MVDENRFGWRWNGQPIPLGVTRRGRGPTVLLLPAPSSISTRDEMGPLAETLAADFTSLAVDLPGFGAGAKPRLPWSPDAYRAFLRDVSTWARPAATVAAGHMGVYALQQAALEPGSLGRLVLAAPSWRGPLPTMMKRRPGWLARVAALADVPVIGQALYRVNVNRAMISVMTREHVYGDPGWLTPARLAGKRAVTDARGARHASVRFVTGQLDPAESREDVLASARRLDADVLLVYGDATPPKSRAEMEALAAVPHIRGVTLAGGKLAVHEEKAGAVADAIRKFLAEA